MTIGLEENIAAAGAGSVNANPYIKTSIPPKIPTTEART